MVVGMGLLQLPLLPLYGLIEVRGDVVYQCKFGTQECDYVAHFRIYHPFHRHLILILSIGKSLSLNTSASGVDLRWSMWLPRTNSFPLLPVIPLFRVDPAPLRQFCFTFGLC